MSTRPEATLKSNSRQPEVRLWKATFEIWSIIILLWCFTLFFEIKHVQKHMK